MTTIPDDATLLLASVNNTRTRLGLAVGGDVVASRSLANADADSMAREASTLASDHAKPAVILIASVNDAVAGPLGLSLRDVFPGADVFRLGRDLPVPIPLAVDEPEGVGVDRQLDALAAYERAQQACVVVDVGTAITVDFVDGQGTFQGGAIAPGLSLMLDALHRKTERLPELAYEAPDPAHGAFGKTTRHAMQLGVGAAVRGLVRERAEAYAEAFGAFPVIVATGGDMGVLEGDGLIEHFVPDLTLQGMILAAKRALDDDHELDL
ncbi:MAG: type III pantothenate kinase [Planctomycetota bacterium]